MPTLSRHKPAWWGGGEDKLTYTQQSDDVMLSEIV